MNEDEARISKASSDERLEKTKAHMHRAATSGLERLRLELTKARVDVDEGKSRRGNRTNELVATRAQRLLMASQDDGKSRRKPCK